MKSKKREFSHREIVIVKDFIIAISILLNPEFRKNMREIGTLDVSRANVNLFEQDHRYYIDVKWGKFYEKYSSR